MAQEATSHKKEMVGPMFASFQTVEDVSLDGFGAVVGCDACLHAAHVIRRIVIEADIATQVHRNQPAYPGLRFGDPGTDGMDELFEEKAVYGHARRAASVHHFQGFVHRKKMPSHRLGNSRSATERKPISPRRAFLFFAAVAPKLPQRRDHAPAGMLRIGKLSDLYSTLPQHPS